MFTHATITNSSGLSPTRWNWMCIILWGEVEIILFLLFYLWRYLCEDRAKECSLKLSDLTRVLHRLLKLIPSRPTSALSAKFNWLIFQFRFSFFVWSSQRGFPNLIIHCDKLLCSKWHNIIIFSLMTQIHQAGLLGACLSLFAAATVFNTCSVHLAHTWLTLSSHLLWLPRTFKKKLNNSVCLDYIIGMLMCVLVCAVDTESQTIIYC